MIDLQAISLGYAVPHNDFNSHVHSVFPESANLQMYKGRQLLTLIMAESVDLPQGIRMKALGGFSFEKALQPGDRIVCQSRILRDERNRLSIDLRHAKRWTYQLPRPDADLISPSIAAAWSVVWQALDERQRRTDAELRVAELFFPNLPEQATVTRRMGVLMRGLVEAARNLDPSFRKSVAGLIGLGRGLTPSGDDFLVGFLAGLHCMAGKKAERLVFLSNLEKLIVDLSSQTNDISFTYLYHAARGQVSSRLAALMEAITQGVDSDRLLPAAEDAMRVGHSSGMETVTGLLAGLYAWGNGITPV
jgi:hypothetical protein